MTPEVRKALEGSIRKWQRIVGGTGSDLGPNNCDLCKMFYTGGAQTCVGCPVREKTGHWGCIGTPYELWEHHHEIRHHTQFYKKAHCKQCMSLAKKELAFLKSLRDTPAKPGRRKKGT